jgi:hypothetical protein
MATGRGLMIPLALLAALLPAQALARPALPPRARAAASAHALLTSKNLWATIDVCSARDQPDTLGIRGSMPGDGQPRDKMYMSFRLQYLERRTMRWTDLAASGTSTGFLAVGAAGSTRQDGSSFVLLPVAGKPAFTLRGIVDFQWRRGKTVLLSAARPTTAGHESLAGADPAGYSAATCLIG